MAPVFSPHLCQFGDNLTDSRRLFSHKNRNSAALHVLAAVHSGDNFLKSIIEKFCSLHLLMLWLMMSIAAVFRFGRALAVDPGVGICQRFPGEQAS